MLSLAMRSGPPRFRGLFVCRCSATRIFCESVRDAAVCLFRSLSVGAPAEDPSGHRVLSLGFLRCGAGFLWNTFDSSFRSRSGAPALMLSSRAEILRMQEK